MAKLVVLTQSMAGRSVELTAERTTVGRVEENAFQIAEPSVSSRHAEILLRGSDIVVKDLGSTNGTFINGEKITEAVLKPGQTLRFGNIELKLDVPGAPAAPAPAPSAPPAAAPPAPKKEPAKATAGGVNISDLESGGRVAGFDTNTIFTKKKKNKTMYFWIAMGGALLIIIILIIVALVKIPH
jgi:hypothetical protein